MINITVSRQFNGTTSLISPALIRMWSEKYFVDAIVNLCVDSEHRRDTGTTSLGIYVIVFAEKTSWPHLTEFECYVFSGYEKKHLAMIMESIYIKPVDQLMWAKLILKPVQRIARERTGWRDQLDLAALSIDQQDTICSNSKADIEKYIIYE